MLTTHRKRLILEALRRDGQVVAKALSVDLGLSEDTIRRDLRELAQEGKLQRVHGGALPASPAAVDLAGRKQLVPDAKIAIGRAAARMVQSGQIIILDGGTTTEQIALHLPKDLAATVITHSPTIAVALISHPTVEVIMIGGRLFKHSAVTVGTGAAQAIARIRADIFFMGVTGLRPDIGATTGDAEEADVKRALAQSAAETIVLVSNDKLNAASPFVIVPLAEISGMVVERSASVDLLAAYEEHGITVTRA
jgi:DeoR/GlpR family transcriptional regulator of sugar metabolism